MLYRNALDQNAGTMGSMRKSSAIRIQRTVGVLTKMVTKFQELEQVDL